MHGDLAQARVHRRGARRLHHAAQFFEAGPGLLDLDLGLAELELGGLKFGFRDQALLRQLLLPLEFALFREEAHLGLVHILGRLLQFRVEGGHGLLIRQLNLFQRLLVERLSVGIEPFNVAQAPGGGVHALRLLRQLGAQLRVVQLDQRPPRLGHVALLHQHPHNAGLYLGADGHRLGRLDLAGHADVAGPRDAELIFQKALTRGLGLGQLLLKIRYGLAALQAGADHPDERGRCNEEEHGEPCRFRTHEIHLPRCA